MTGVLTGREEDTGERSPREDRGRDWGDVATSQGKSGTTRGCKRQEESSPGAFREKMAQQTLLFGTCSLQDCEN